MHDIQGHNKAHTDELLSLAGRTGADLHVIELDVTSQDSANAAVATVLRVQGQLDVVHQNAGHLYVGFVESFTAEDVNPASIFQPWR